MYLAHLSLTNFRSYRRLELSLPPGMVVLQGANAQGKTNLLEAVYLLAIARSFRAEHERELLHWNAVSEGHALVKGTVQRRDREVQVVIGFQRLPGAEQGTPVFQVRKRIRVNGTPRLASGLVGQANAVLFTAEDIQLVQGAPSLRRRYLDILLSQVESRYLRSLQRYQRVLTQRNHLLRLLREGRAAGEELRFWDEELAREGGYLLVRRREVVEALASLAQGVHQELTTGSESLELSYASTVPLAADAEQQAQALLGALAQSGARERALAMTLVGPHRDDVKLLINGVDMELYASRGQARTLALALRLAEAAYLQSLTGEEPILLLDDVLSELDLWRRRQVLERAQAHQQALITTTDLVLLPPPFLQQATLLEAKEGTVTGLEDGP
ncbi:MAG: DNA replication/repair protein RecF [Dehalococcoidia bacterium]